MPHVHLEILQYIAKVKILIDNDIRLEHLASTNLSPIWIHMDTLNILNRYMAEWIESLALKQ